MALRKLVCLPMCRDVSSCILRERCAYAVCFETVLPPHSDRFRTQDRIPHPLVLDVPFSRREEYSEGDRLDFGVTLFGRAIEHFPYFVAAAQKMAEMGLGSERVRFRLLEVRDAAGQILWPGRAGTLLAAPRQKISPSEMVRDGLDRTRIRFLTPLRVMEDRGLAKEISFRALCRGVLGRYSSMAYFHCGTQLSLDFREVLDAASEVRTVGSDMRKVSLARWSNRQKQKIPLDGLLGTMDFEGKAIERLYPFLKAGEVLHAGKGTVFGLGKYVLEEE